MTTTGKLVVALLLVGAVGGGWYYASDRTKGVPVAENTATETANESSTTTPQSGKKMAFSEFIKNNTGSFKCTVNQNLGSVQSENIVYMSNKMMRGDSLNTSQGKTFTANFILRDGYVYSWSSLAPTTGFKIKVETDVEGNPTGAAAGSYSWDTSKVGDYNCEAWTADASLFVVPTNVTFQMMN